MNKRNIPFFIIIIAVIAVAAFCAIGELTIMQKLLADSGIDPAWAWIMLR